MPRWGYTLFSELNPPGSLVDQAVAAEESGFDWLAMSDHIHPWLSSHTDSPFAWTVWGAVAERTDRVDLASFVTCPFMRYHPAIIAQAAATVALLSDGRFTLGLGAGERLNEHVVGRGWPAVDVRHEMLAESIEIMRALWDGGYVTYRGRHLTVEDARVFSLPETPPRIGVAGSGEASMRLAAEHGHALILTDPLPEVVAEFKDRVGPQARVYGQVPLAWDRDADTAVDAAQRFAFGVTGWKVMSELPNVVNFDAAAATTTREHVASQVGHGPDVQGHLDAIQPFVDAGHTDICVVQVGDDKDGFMRFWAEELGPALS